MNRLTRETGMPRALCVVLVARGFLDADALDAYLNPRLSRSLDPFLLPQMDRAVDRLIRAIKNDESLVVYGDYDVDGITSTALLVRVLRALGLTVHPFLPSRMDDGYGLGTEPVRRCIEAFHPSCLITVDCGTSSVEAVEAARAAGVEVIVTDHHEPGPHVANAVAVVNPKLGSPDDPARLLAGVGVTFKLCHALLKRMRAEGMDERGVDLRHYLDLVALGTVADMVPLEQENRALVRHGLAQINQTRWVGLRALIEVAGVREAVDTYHVGFMLGPRLNAAGRLGTATTALNLLLTDDAEAARGWANELDAANKERQTVEAEIVEQAFQQVDAWFRPDQHFGLVAAQQDWHPGVIGIVASRLCARYHRPIVMIALDEQGVGRGSCRSISSFNIVSALDECASLLRKHGGHPMAAGLEIEASQVEAFKQQFNQVAKARLEGTDLRPVQRVDAWISLAEGDRVLQEHIERMNPFGLGNPKPVWAARGVRLLGPPRVLKEKHLKMTLLDGNIKLEAIAFNLAHKDVPEDRMDMVFQLGLNRYQGRETLQAVVQDFRASDSSE